MCASEGKDFPKEEIARVWTRRDRGGVMGAGGGQPGSQVAGARGGEAAQGNSNRQARGDFPATEGLWRF